MFEAFPYAQPLHETGGDEQRSCRLRAREHGLEQAELIAFWLIWLGRRHWGRGHMTRVVATYLAWVVPARGLRRIEANVLDINPASARVLEKNGFVEEGRRRGAILKPDGLHDLRLFGRLWPG